MNPNNQTKVKLTHKKRLDEILLKMMDASPQDFVSLEKRYQTRLSYVQNNLSDIEFSDLALSYEMVQRRRAEMKRNSDYTAA